MDSGTRVQGIVGRGLTEKWFECSRDSRCYPAARSVTSGVCLCPQAGGHGRLAPESVAVRERGDGGCSSLPKRASCGLCS